MKNNIFELRRNNSDQEKPRSESGRMVSYEEFLKRKEEKELGKKIEEEKGESRKRFSELIGLVDERYQHLHDTARKNYARHNEQVLDLAIELAIRNGFSEEETWKLEMAAILHDAAKADKVPEENQGVPHYVLAMHGKIAADEIPEVLTDEYLESIGVKFDFESARQDVAQAIMEHMGPRPGFMEKILNEFNQEMEMRGGSGVNYPEAKSKIGKALLGVDMVGLISPEGIEKIFGDRMIVEKFRNEDFEEAEKYNEAGVDLKPGEAALLSAFDNFQSVRGIFHGGDKDINGYVLKLIERLERESKKMEFPYGHDGRKISWYTASEKKRRYEEAKRLSGIRMNVEAL